MAESDQKHKTGVNVYPGFVTGWENITLCVFSGPPGELWEPPSHSPAQRRLQGGPGQRVCGRQHLQAASLRTPLLVGATHQDANTRQHSQLAHALQRNQHGRLARRSGQKDARILWNAHT